MDKRRKNIERIRKDKREKEKSIKNEEVNG